MRVEPAGLAVFVFERVRGNDPLAGSNPADPSDADPAVADHVLLDDEALLPVVAFDDARGPIAEFRIDVFVPEIERLENVTVRIDNVVSACHWRPSEAQVDPPNAIPRRHLNIIQNAECRHADSCGRTFP